MKDKSVRLTACVKGGGWASKLAPGNLEHALVGFEFPTNENVLVGLTTSDDAGVYRVSDEFAPDADPGFFYTNRWCPYDFGRIAAANSLSDIYAMGGIPKKPRWTIVAYPMASMGSEPLREMLAGGVSLQSIAVPLLFWQRLQYNKQKWRFSYRWTLYLFNQGKRCPLARLTI